MKNLALAVVIVFVAISARAAESDYSRMVSVLKLAANGEYGHGCKLNVEDGKNNSTLVSIEGAKGLMYVSLKEGNVKVLKELMRKGTEIYIMRVGQGTIIEVDHNSDAFDRTTIKRGKDSITCQNDY